MQAAINGAKIEFRHIIGGACAIIDKPTWNWSDYTYQVKEEPKKTVELYQWLCYTANSWHHITTPRETEPNNVIRRLDETKITVEV